MFRTTLAAFLGALLADVLSAPAPLDLDVGVPPGSPTGWGRQFPVITPRRPFRPPPVTGAPPQGGTRTVAGRTGQLQVNIADSFGIVRILTWDLPRHLTWIVGPPPAGPTGPVTGGVKGEAPMPLPGSALYWTSIAALLRLMLHPQLVSELEVIAHLVEIGEPVLGVLEAAAPEKSLVATCREIRKRLPAGRRAACPLPGKTPRETMLQRFLCEELVAAHPYDPEGGFGRRLFLFVEELEPLLIQYCGHADPFLRRNATAALGRCETARSCIELVRLGSVASDAVVQMRALAAIGGNCAPVDATALINELKNTVDPVERAALIQALGRMRARDAVPQLLAIADLQHPDPDTLMAVLEALTRIPHLGPGADGVARFAARVRDAVRHEPRRFRVREDVAAPAADAPDTPATRGEILDQLAVLLLARLHPDDAAAVRAVLDLETAPPDPRRLGRVRGFAGLALGPVHPPVQILLLETLGILGSAAEPWLTHIAEDASVEPALRGQALARLPMESGSELAVRLLRVPEEAQVQACALEVLAAAGDPRLDELARELLRDCRQVTAATPVKRYLWLTAVRVLDSLRRLRSEDVVPLLAGMKAPPPAARSDPRGEVARQVERLVHEVAEGLSPQRQHESLDKILDVMIEQSLNARITAPTRNNARETLVQQLASLSGRRNDLPFRQQVVTAMLQFLLGFTVVPPLRAEFAPVVMLEEEVLLALGRTQSAEASAALVGFLAGAAESPFRAHACLALGLLGRAESGKHLVRFLLDSDGFVRFCAYESLRRLTQQDYQADWMYGDTQSRVAAAEQYFKWCGRAR